jgi:hypothetical protein
MIERPVHVFSEVQLPQKVPRELQSRMSEESLRSAMGALRSISALMAERVSVICHGMKVTDLVFTGFNGRVAALHRQSGTVVWDWRAPKGRAFVSLLLESDLLVVSVDGYMYGLDPLTGAERWFNPMKGFGTGVTSLVSVRGVSSAVVPLAAAQLAAQSHSADGAHPPN